MMGDESFSEEAFLSQVSNFQEYYEPEKTIRFLVPKIDILDPKDTIYFNVLSNIHTKVKDRRITNQFKKPKKSLIKDSKKTEMEENK